MPLIQRLLIALILLYRRFLSGRLPNVRCSFAADETCSAFGLRIARAARSGREAIARIARRIRRCGDACLLSDGTRLGWSELHDESPAEIVRAMRADGEGDAAISRMVQTRLVVARWCGDRAGFEACRAALRSIERPRVISLAAVEERARRRIAWSTAIAILAAVFAPLAPLVAVPLAMLAGASAVIGHTRLTARANRFARIARSAPQRACSMHASSA